MRSGLPRGRVRHEQSGAGRVWVAQNGAAPGGPQQVQQASWTQRVLAPVGLAQPDPAAAHQQAVAAAKAQEAQRLAFDPLALDHQPGPPTPAFYVSMAELSYRGAQRAAGDASFTKRPWPWIQRISTPCWRGPHGRP